LDKFLPFLDVSGPDGQQFHVELANDRVTIGRFEQFNDVALEPDPQQLITRKVHCAVERDTHGWWVVDNGSVNRTCHLSSAASIRGKRHKSAMSIVINSGLQLNLWMGQDAPGRKHSGQRKPRPSVLGGSDRILISF